MKIDLGALASNSLLDNGIGLRSKRRPAGSAVHADVVHVSEAYGGGVQSAISRYIENSPELHHRLLVRPRSDHDVGTVAHDDSVYLSGSLPAFLKQARRYILDTRPDVVHLHSSYAGLLRAVLPASQKVVYTPHSYAFLRTDVCRAQRAAFYAVEAMLSRRSQTIAAVSPFEAASAARLSSKTARVTYLPNVLRTQVFPAHRVLGSGARPSIVTVGRITPQKDPKFFAETVAATRTVADWRWIGDGEPAMRRLLEAAGVEVTGWMNNCDVLSGIAEADLYLHSARWEGAPVTLVEAAAIGTPVLARSITCLEGLGFQLSGSTPEESAVTIDRFFADPAFRAATTVATKESAAVHHPTVQRAVLGQLYRVASSSAEAACAS